MAAVLALGSWVLVDHFSGTSQSVTTPTPSLSGFDATMALEVSGLQRALRAAGYEIPIGGGLDPVTKSAAADYLRVGDDSTLGAGWSRLLQGTILIGRRDPAAWNARFGVNRPVRMVERPLTGPDGQLDQYGNIR